jgi:hypothetical protein
MKISLIGNNVIRKEMCTWVSMVPFNCMLLIDKICSETF